MDDLEQWLGDFWSEWGSEVVTTIVVVVVGVVATVVIRSAVRRWLGRLQAQYTDSGEHEQRERGQRFVTITQVVRILALIGVWVAVILTVMAIWGLPLGPLIAVGATLGVGLGFGAQNLVADVIGGFFILVEDQYRVGDVVRIAGVSGKVEQITLRTTVLRDLDGNRHHVHNGHDGVVTNLTSEWTRVVMDVPVSYDTDLDHAMRVISEEAHAVYVGDEWRDSFLDDPEMLGVEELAGSSINIRLLLTTVGDDQWPIRRLLLKRIKERFDDEGIEIPYQYVNVVQVSSGSGSPTGGDVRSSPGSDGPDPADSV